jgi:hypothetical protein
VTFTKKNAARYGRMGAAAAKKHGKGSYSRAVRSYGAVKRHADRLNDSSAGGFYYVVRKHGKGYRLEMEQY